MDDQDYEILVTSLQDLLLEDTITIKSMREKLNALPKAKYLLSKYNGKTLVEKIRYRKKKMMKDQNM